MAYRNSAYEDKEGIDILFVISHFGFIAFPNFLRGLEPPRSFLVFEEELFKFLPFSLGLPSKSRSWLSVDDAHSVDKDLTDVAGGPFCRNDITIAVGGQSQIATENLVRMGVAEC